ncbi:hypothetical protein PVAG01_06764 [Phlyctema vagabunda]|uniref:Extracellular membrane protein CFEM domain-containing protein n=1 Tax=Phlyctema vagabunda TaxID=108571 RepID=A0ABR4PH03_9HELO
MATFSLSSEFSEFIPTCAEACFISFIDSNFPSKLCSNTPTLDCLCSNNSTSGYTVGEGAVQCILSQDQLGTCKATDADLAAIARAFTMCNGQENAVPNTHATLTATVFIPTASPSLVLIPPGSSAAISTSSNSRTISTTTSKPTSSSSSSSSSISSPTSSSSFFSSSSSIASSFTTSFGTTSASPAEPTQTTDLPPALNQTSPGLSGPKIAGIAVGAAGGAALLAICLILLLCIRRRRKASRNSDVLPFQADPASSLKYDRGFLGPTEKSYGHGPGATPTGVAAKVAPPVPPRIDTGSPYMFSRRSLRPDTIGLAISPESDTQTIIKKQRRSSKLLPEKPSLTLQMPQQNAKARYSRRKSMFNRGSLMRESTGTQFEEDIDSAFEADDDYRRGSTDKILDNATGIWKPQQSRSNLPIPDFPMPADTRAFHGQPPNTKSIIPDYYIRPLEIGRGRTLASFSQPRKPDSSIQPQLQLRIPTETGRPVTGTSSVYSVPSMAPNQSEIGRSLTDGSRLPKSYNQGGPYDFDEPETPTPAEKKPSKGELSPVVESPKSPKTPTSATGKSPVSYPRIPKLLSPSTIRMVPPPAQPDFTQVFSSGTVRRTPSKQESENLKPWRQAELAAQQARTAQQQPQQQERSEQQQQARPNLQQYKSYRPPSEHIQTQFDAPSLRPSALPMDGSNRGSSSTISTSSLLAKRRGEKQAAALALKSEEEVRARWRVLKERDIAAAKSPDWKPQLAKFERTELPNTPGWIPRLTPTRRGDELFLSVQ